MLTSKLMCFVATRNAAAALTFYRDTLGLTLLEDGPFALAFDVGGTMLRVQKVGELVPAKHTVLGWEVTDIAAAARDLAERGVGFERYDGMGQDELGIWTSPSGARIAWFKDPDDNTLSLTQFAG